MHFKQSEISPLIYAAFVILRSSTWPHSFQIKIFWGAVKITYGTIVIMIEFIFNAKSISRHIKTCKAQCNMVAINPPVPL